MASRRGSRRQEQIIHVWWVIRRGIAQNAEKKPNLGVWGFLNGGRDWPRTLDAFWGSFLGCCCPEIPRLLSTMLHILRRCNYHSCIPHGRGQREDALSQAGRALPHNPEALPPVSANNNWVLSTSTWKCCPSVPWGEAWSCCVWWRPSFKPRPVHPLVIMGVRLVVKDGSSLYSDNYF